MEAAKTYKKRVFVREATPVPNEDGNYYFTFSPVNREADEQEIRAKIDLKNPLHRDNIASLIDNEKDVTTVEFRTDGSDETGIPIITNVAAGLNREARKIAVGGTHASTWTKELDEKLDIHYQYCAFERASDELDVVATSPERMDQIRKHFDKEWTRYQKKFLRGEDAENPDVSGVGIEEILRGEEGDKQVRYNTNVALEKQVDLHGMTSGARRSAIRNYSLQKSLIRSISDNGGTVEVDGEKKNYLQAEQEELVRERTLYAGHPTRNASDHEEIGREHLENVGNLTVQGVMEMMGAKAASREHDSIKSAVVIDESGESFNFVEEIIAKATDLAGPDSSDQKKIGSFIGEAKALSGIAIEDTKNPIRLEVDKAMQPGFSRGDPVIATKELGGKVAGIGSDVIKGIQEYEGAAF